MPEPEDPVLPDQALDAAEADEVIEADEVVAAEVVVEADEAFEAAEVVETLEVLEAATAAQPEAAVVEEAFAPDEAEEDEEADVLEEPAESLAAAPIAPPPPAAQAVTGVARPSPGKGARPDLIDRRDPLYRECKGYRLRLDPPDLARLRELAGSRGKSDDEIGEAFFDGQAERLAAAIADDVPTPSEIRVVVDPYSRQAFLALENRIRGILSF